MVALSVNIAALLSSLLSPFMPALAERLRAQLNLRRVPRITNSFYCLLGPGHVIGTPEPLVAEIKQDQLKELKERFAGAKQPSVNSGEAANKKAADNAAPKADPEKAKQLEKDVAAQGDKVRKMKESGADKDAVSAEVAKLKELKFQLAQAGGGSAPSSSADQKKKEKKKKDAPANNKKKESTPKTPLSEEAQRLGKEVSAQAVVLRKLRDANGDPAAIAAEEAKLWGLKEQLAKAKGVPVEGKKK